MKSAFFAIFAAAAVAAPIDFIREAPVEPIFPRETAVDLGGVDLGVRETTVRCSQSECPQYQAYTSFL